MTRLDDPPQASGPPSAQEAPPEYAPLEASPFVARGPGARRLARCPAPGPRARGRGRPTPFPLAPPCGARGGAAPYVGGLGPRGGAPLSQSAPRARGPPPRFAAELHRFL